MLIKLLKKKPAKLLARARSNKMVSCNYEVPFATEILKVNLTKTNQCELCY